MKKYLIATIIFISLAFQNSLSDNIYLKKVGYFNSDTLTDTLILWKYNPSIFLPKNLILSDSLSDSITYSHTLFFEFENLDTTIVDAFVHFYKLNNDDFDDIMFTVIRDSVIADSTIDSVIKIEAIYYIPGQDFQNLDTITILHNDSLQYSPYKSAILSLGKGINATDMVDYNGFKMVNLNFPLLDSLIEELELTPKINTIKNQSLTKEKIKVEVYPNPANNLLEISFEVKEDQIVKIYLFDLLGKLNIVKELNIDPMYSLKLDVSDLNSHLYYLKINFPLSGHSEIFPILIIH